MNKLIRWRRVSDGVDVDCELGIGGAENLTLHTLHQQAGTISSDEEAIAFMKTCAAEILAAIVTEDYTVICEDGTILTGVV